MIENKNAAPMHVTNYINDSIIEHGGEEDKDKIK